MLGKKLFTVAVCLHIIICSASAKKSVFIISDFEGYHAQAYSIEGDQVNFQADVDISSYTWGLGAIGNAVWPEKELMFVTFEGFGMIVWGSTKNLDKVGEFYTGIDSPAGIVIDKEQGLIYVMNRHSHDLYIYSFDETGNTLFEEGAWYLNSSPNSYIDGMGLALDESRKLLYVTSDGSNRVHIYDTDDLIGGGGSVDPNSYVDIVVGENPREAVGIAVDPVRRYMYTAGFAGNWWWHNYLVRTQLDPPYTSTEVLIDNGYGGTQAVGIDVDKDTGYVYATTQIPDFRVYDSNLVFKDTEANNILGPAGVSVGGWYKATSCFNLVKDNNDPNDNCVDPIVHINLNFDILWDVNGCPDTNMTIIDRLPVELDYNSLTTPAGDYNDYNRTVKWNISGNSGHIVLRTNVNDYAAPGETITNIAIMEGDNYLKETSCQVSICNWDGSIIYVDKDAMGSGNGTNWDDAYTDLVDGIAAARELSPFITAIWVAAGTYKPVNDINIPDYQNISFELPDNVALIGHFGGIGTYETSPDQRVLSNPANETILEGQVGPESSQAVQNVIKINNISSCLIDDFTIKGSSSKGIYFYGVSASLVNCKIINNQNNGIYCENYSYPDIHNCLFMNNLGNSIYSDTSEPDISYCIFDGNGAAYYGLNMINGSVSNITNSEFKNYTVSAIYGIYSTANITGCNIFNNSYYGIQGYSSNMTVSKTVIGNNSGYGLYLEYYSDLGIENSVIRKSGYRGIYLSQNSSAKIVNNWIHNNGAAMISSYGSGVYFENQVGIPDVRNNTIFDNYTYGIECSQNGADPNIRNCIISGNDINDLYRVSGTFNKVNYCLLQHAHSGTGNITGSPGFLNPTDPNDLHIADTSQCKNAGDPDGSYGDETDIDGETRISYERVDIGADEFYWSKADYNEDGIVDFFDFALFAPAWRSNNANISIDQDSDVDIDDLKLFCDEWLWEFGGGNSQWMVMAGGEVDGFSMGMAEEIQTNENAEENASGLMLSDVKSSIDSRPARLRNRTDKFYSIKAPAAISIPIDVNISNETVGLSEQMNEPGAIGQSSELAEVTEAEVGLTEEQIEENVEWLDQLWQSGGLEGWSEQEYLEFRIILQEMTY